MLYSYIMYMKSFENESLYLLWMFCVSIIKETKAITTFIHIAENGRYPPTQNGDIRSLFLLFILMAVQN